VRFRLASGGFHGPGAGDVEEAEPLVVAHLLVDGSVGLELVGDDLAPHPVAHWPAVAREVDLDGAASTSGPGRQARDDGDRELEALGGVDRHDAHGVVVGLGQHRLRDPRPLGGLLLDPVEVGAQAPAGGLAPGPGLVDHEADAAPHVAGPALGEAQLEGAAVARDAVEELGGGVPVAGLVDRPEVGEPALDDGALGIGRRGRVERPGAALRHLVPEEVVVAAAEQRRAQRGDDPQVVGGVVGGPQHHEEVAHGSAGVDQRARLRAVRDARRGEGLLEEGQRGAGRDQEGDVAQPAWAPRLGAVGLPLVHRPPLRERGDDGVGDVAALGRAHDVGARPARVGLPADHRDRRAHRRLATLREQLHVPGLRGEGHVGVGRLAEQGGEGVVHPVDDRGDGAEVRLEGDRPPGLGREALLGGEERADVGAAEPVDRLLRVTHHEQPTGLDRHVGPVVVVGPVGVGGGDAHGQLDLDRVGVLELVEQQPLVAAVERGSHDGALHRVAQHPAGEHEEVVELEGARLSPALGGGERVVAQRGADAPGAAVEHPLAHLLHGVAHRAELRVHLVLVAPPRALGAGVAVVLGWAAEQDVHEVELVTADPLQALAERREVVEGEPQPVAGVDARATQLHQGGELGVDLRDEVAGRGRIGGGGRNEVVDEVPRRVEGEGEGAELLRVDAGRVEQEDRALELWVLEELVEDAGPAPVERHRGRDLVEHLDLGGELRLHRVLGEEPLGERVEGADGGPVELAEGVAAARRLLRRGGGVGLPALQLSPHPVAQLGAGLLGEGDGGDLAESHRARSDEGDDPCHQRGGLAGAGPGLHEQGGAEVGRDALAGGVVGRGGHRRHDLARLAQGV
jgi:hypothetical protein